MAKKDDKKDTPENKLETEVDPFVGGEDDDLADMEYIQNEETTMKVDTHPPETKEEAEILAEQLAAEAKAKEEEETDDDDAPQQEAEEVEEADEKTPVLKEEEEEEEKEEEVKEEKEEEDVKIPKDRFDEVNDRMKKAEGEVKSLKTQLESVVEEKHEEPEPEPYDYKVKEKAAMDALLEGDSDKYSEINEEIRAAEKAEYLREAQKLAAQGDQELHESLTFEEAGAKIEVDYPQFVEGTENYNHEAREEMLDLYVGYSKSGIYTRVQALQRAAAKAAKFYAFEVTTEEVAPDNVVDIKKPDIKKKVEASNAQPPVMETSTGGPREEPKMDINSMSDEEFDNLPESTKMRMRGDIL